MPLPQKHFILVDDDELCGHTQTVTMSFQESLPSDIIRHGYEELKFSEPVPFSRASVHKQAIPHVDKGA